METIIYKEINNCEIKGDFYPTQKKNAPLLVYIHGGGLIWGTRNDMNKEQITLYNEAGYNVFTIDYRLAPETKLPDIIQDIEDCFIWLQAEGKDKLDYDVDRIAVIGSSAGGYLALSAGTFKIKPKAVVSFYGYGNILGTWYTSPSIHFTKTKIVPEMLARQLIKNKPISSAPIQTRYAIYLYCRQHGKWLDYVTGLSPSIYGDKLKPYCPVNNLDTDYPPTLLLHGDRDEDVPYKESVQMSESLSNLGVQNKLITIPNGKHTFDLEMQEPVVIAAFEQVLQFLKENL